jgi:Na+/glutamate symporter
MKKEFWGFPLPSFFQNFISNIVDNQKIKKIYLKKVTYHFIAKFGEIFLRMIIAMTPSHH